MEEEIKRLLKRNLEVSEQSFKILKKMHRAQTIGRLLKMLKWVLIIALTFGTYYYIQPYMQTFWQTVSDIKSDLSAPNVPNMLEGAQNLFKPR